METKDRIRQIMEDQQMTQQVFADFLEQSPATLSSIFNGRTKPTLNIVDSIKKKLPHINVEWLLYGTGEMYSSPFPVSTDSTDGVTAVAMEPMIDFDTPVTPPSELSPVNGLRKTQPDYNHEELKIIDKQPRKVTEIRVYYDDQTYETFVPAKK